MMAMGCEMNEIAGPRSVESKRINHVRVVRPRGGGGRGAVEVDKIDLCQARRKRRDGVREGDIILIHGS